MAVDEFAYLQPGFDASTLTVPRLRSILVAHNVAYPSSAKKPDLVNLFNDEVAPQGRKLLKAQAQTKRSTRGIVDVPTSQESLATTDDDDDDDEDIAPVVTPARRSTRRSTRLASEDIVEPTPRTSRRTTAPLSTVKKPSSRHARLEEYEEQPEERHVKRQAQPRKAPVEEPVIRHQGAESPFSRDNPFQSGSSPPSAPRSKSRERRRTTMAPSTDRERRRSRDARRRTDGYTAVKQDQGIVVPSRSTFDVAAPTSQHIDMDIDIISPGEEFNPEENQELVKAEKFGETTIARRPKRRQKKSGVAKAAPWTILLAMVGGVATVWRQEKLQVGYCGVGQPTNMLGGVEIPEWAAFVQPQCEPCPQHAICFPDLRTECDPDFILTPHPLSLGGLLPLPPTCEPDSEKVRKIKTVADFAVESELRTRNAQYECSETTSPEISVAELKATVSAKKSRRMTDEEFEELWGAAIGEVVGREEVESRVDEIGSVRYLRSTSLARVPLTCAVRRSLRLAIRQNLSRLVVILAIAMSSVYGKHALTTRKTTKQQAKRLAGMALDKLATQASLHVEDPVAYPEPYISMVALRDDVLREEFRAKERTRLWEVVKGLVEGNANVRTMVREGRSGDVSRVWEWIGAVQRIEGSAKRKSGGLGRITGSPGRMMDVGVEGSDSDGGNLKNSVQKWDEGGSSYY
ncbi:hypothetical protein AAFC00_001099 [Neodothiora populina]|uniref:Sister chromatid separation protein n=1 Tax=Neodothiora populina TaxID=2781224 RepID=A0ABR3PN61_9PEZI